MFSVTNMIVSESVMTSRELIVNDQVVFRDNQIGLSTDNFVETLAVSGNVTFGSLGTFLVPKVTPMYVRGVGTSQTASESMLIIGRDRIYAETNDGLTLTIIKKSNHRVQSTTVYNTALSPLNADALEAAISQMTTDDLGCITGYGNWERYVDSDLRAMFMRVGLGKLAGVTQASLGRPYAGCFEPSSFPFKSFKAHETMFQNSSEAPFATVSGFLINGTFSLTGSEYNYMISVRADDVALFVDDQSRVGRGTIEPEANFHVNGGVIMSPELIDGRTFFEFYSENDSNYGLMSRSEDNQNEGVFWIGTGAAANSSHQIKFGDTDGTTVRHRFQMDGRAFSQTYAGGQADYAEWFDHESSSVPGDLIGVNLDSGYVRKYQAGDRFIGIHSSDPMFIANRDITHSPETQAETMTLVGLMGQLRFNPEHVRIQDGIVYTTDGVRVGPIIGDHYVLLR